MADVHFVTEQDRAIAVQSERSSRRLLSPHRSNYVRVEVRLRSHRVCVTIDIIPYCHPELPGNIFFPVSGLSYELCCSEILIPAADSKIRKEAQSVLSYFYPQVSCDLSAVHCSLSSSPEPRCLSPAIPQEIAPGLSSDNVDAPSAAGVDASPTSSIEITPTSSSYNPKKPRSRVLSNDELGDQVFKKICSGLKDKNVWQVWQPDLPKLVKISESQNESYEQFIVSIWKEGDKQVNAAKAVRWFYRFSAASLDYAAPSLPRRSSSSDSSDQKKGISSSARDRWRRCALLVNAMVARLRRDFGKKSRYVYHGLAVKNYHLSVSNRGFSDVDLNEIADVATTKVKDFLELEGSVSQLPERFNLYDPAVELHRHVKIQLTGLEIDQILLEFASLRLESSTTTNRKRKHSSVSLGETPSTSSYETGDTDSNTQNSGNANEHISVQGDSDLESPDFVGAGLILQAATVMDQTTVVNPRLLEGVHQNRTISPIPDRTLSNTLVRAAQAAETAENTNNQDSILMDNFVTQHDPILMDPFLSEPEPILMDDFVRVV